MGYKRKSFEQVGFDELEYKRYFHRNQSEYIRLRLRCVKDYAHGMEFAALSERYQIHEQSCRSYINTYISGGFEQLCTPITRNQPSLLTQEQEAAFKRILLDKFPFEVGLEGNIWTGKLMRQYLKKTYAVVYKSGIYDLLERLGLSYQRAHLDYGNADEQEQYKFIKELEHALLDADDKTAVVKFDEFSICERPTAYYGWAEKNTRPKVKTNEKKEREKMDS